MPKEYIERGALLLEVEENKPLNWNDEDAEIQAEIDFDKFARMIKKQPTADVVEVEHGEWKRCEDYEMYWYECSNCGGEPLRNPMSNADFLSDYCPYCGVKMYGERKDGV